MDMNINVDMNKTNEYHGNVHAFCVLNSWKNMAYKYKGDLGY